MTNGITGTIQQIGEAGQTAASVAYYAKGVGVVAQLPQWQQAIVGTSLVVTPGLALGALALRLFGHRDAAMILFGATLASTVAAGVVAGPKIVRAYSS